MTYWMFREDGCGDSGGMSVAIVPNADYTHTEYEHNARPRIGVQMRVGSTYARTYQYQDYWSTTLITEIVSESEKEVIFKTKSGSVYTWKIV
jgi:hypothetical protein